MIQLTTPMRTNTTSFGEPASSAKKINQLLCTGAMEGVREGVCVIICNLARLDSLMCGYTEKLFCWLPVLLSSAYDVKRPPRTA